MLNSVAKEWERFAAMVFDKPPSKIQLNEMRKAFYAGAFTILTNVQEIAQPHISEAEGMQHLDNVCEECKAFYAEMMLDYNQRN